LAIDRASDEGDRCELLKLDEECEALELTLCGSERALLFYFRSNVHAALQAILDPRSWSWRQPHREKQLFFLRKARSDEGFDGLESFRRAQITINLGNVLNALGRALDALDLYDSVLATSPAFAMGLGNRGNARSYFSRSLYDRNQAAVILVGAYDDFKAAIDESAVWESDYPGVRAQFEAHANEIASVVDVDKVRSSIDLDRWSLGKSEAERRYRSWALKNQLFLNPLNVLGVHSIAARDQLHMPPHRTDADEPPQYIAWYNQLKQEFCAARFLFFESIEATKKHLADRDIYLVNTLDYPAFGLAVEKMRIAFRISYSLLDKVAGLINACFGFGIQPTQVDIRRIWKERGSPLRLELTEKANLPLRGLYWLSLDLMDESPDAPNPILPEAGRLSGIRNALEHRCLVLRELDVDQSMGIVETMPISRFETDTMTVLKLARSAIVYTSLAIHCEERIKHSGDAGKAWTVDLPAYEGLCAR
jgi:hypothetical protein